MKILVTEDSIGWQNYHKDMLHQIFGSDLQVDGALSAREGYDYAYNNLSEPYDLIISDLQMENDFEPKYAGEWFVEQILNLKEYRKTPIVIISACYNIKMIAELLGVNYLAKSTAANDKVAYKLRMEEVLSI